MGKIFVLEGVDGCGKTLQWTLLKRKFTDNGLKFVALSPFTATNAGRHCRAILLAENNPPLRGEEKLHLFAVLLSRMVKECIAPALEQGVNVLLDRYYLSTLVYQIWLDHVSHALVENTLLTAIGPYHPDRTFILDLPVEVALQRKRKLDLLDAQGDVESLRTCLYAYHLYAKGNMRLSGYEQVTMIDGTQAPESVTDVIWSTISNECS